MSRIVITLHPARSDDALLSVEDAMQQVIDAMKLLSEAESALGEPHEAFVWRLEKASTNSPFTVVAVAEAKNPTVDISAHVRRVKQEVSGGVRQLMERRETPTWMSQDALRVARTIFERSANGIGRMDVDFEGEADALSIDHDRAEAGIRAVEAISALDNLDDLPERDAYGEVEGVMVAAGRYRNRPAIQIRSEMYGFAWCVLSEKLVTQFGDEHSMADIWKGRTLGVTGTVHYERGGRRVRLDARDIREMQGIPPIDLSAVLDPDFTAGMDPLEYLEKLHAGELA